MPELGWGCPFQYLERAGSVPSIPRRAAALTHDGGRSRRTKLWGRCSLVAWWRLSNGPPIPTPVETGAIEA